MYTLFFSSSLLLFLYDVPSLIFCINGSYRLIVIRFLSPMFENKRRYNTIQWYGMYGIFLGPQPVGVQCPLTSSLGEFQVFGTGFSILDNRPYWCPSTFPLRLPNLGVSQTSSIHFSSSATGFNSFFSLQPVYLHPFCRPFTYSLFR